LYTHPQHPLSKKQATDYEVMLKRREKNEPVAYIIGQKDFYGRTFHCDKRALIPRPETEIMIDRALDFLPRHFTEQIKRTNKPCPLHILELGTGSGNIAVTLALELSARHLPATIIATDISKDALAVAQENAERLRATSPLVKLYFLEADLFHHPDIKKYAPYDLVVTNLPYVSTTWQHNPAAQPDVIFFEPDIALFGGKDGLSLYKRFLKEVPAYLSPTGKLLFEYGEDQTASMTPLVTAAFPERTLQVHQDFAGLDRLAEI
jgi:release factor glutamine methyltransferase